MTNCKMYIVVIMLGLLAETVLSITTNNVKKVTISGSQNAQSLTFSSNGEDQLIFRDATFQVRNDDSQASTDPLGNIDVRQMAESNWRPMYQQASLDKQENTLPQAVTTKPPTVIVKPSSRATKFYQFSEMDVMRVPASDQVKRSDEVPSKIASEKWRVEDESSLAKNISNWTDISPRMLPFEESDRMKFDDHSPDTINSLTQVASLDHAEARILKSSENDSPIDEDESSSERNSSRFFRFEDSDRKVERTRIAHGPVGPSKYYDNSSSGTRIAFPKNDGDLSNIEPHRSYETINFYETDSRPQVVSNNKNLYDRKESYPLKFREDVISQPHSDHDQFYTVKATIQIGDWNDRAITPPPPVTVSTRRPRKKKGRIYNHPDVDNRKQDGLNYQQTALHDNYIGYPSQQSQVSGFQYQPNPQQSSNNPYYQYQGNPYPQLDPNGYYYQQYLNNYQPQQPNRYQQPAGGGLPSYYQQQNVPINAAPGAQSGNPLNAQSIFGFLQSIFNFAPGTFGNFPPPAPVNGGNGGLLPNVGEGSPLVSLSSQLRKALDNIAENDDQQCVPKLICMMSRRSSGQGFETYVNRGLLSTVLNAVPDGAPWLKFSRAALLGYGIGANSCDVYYPKCPKDESEIIYYLNNHRGGFFRFFNDGQNGVN
ncbi:uncharacterized protein LOC129770736 [Toxorhynchites rutilus septentrionalis]|uniref:uncharacterized protein LOC129770736 n=1 Tax=Toxorhynchites rutilus septentrionalis TaxID=329112 RepID=UPI002478C903|nr:uncharacterized protein LOC129770736 [Toxorhynchites rutilus septentrionalis]XP_055629746.1 uncharacterized protein LOC129770736 [Toxorhynchites rutilus septentrionalis]